MKALVTGGLGFVGSNLVDLLIEKGCEVSVIDDLSSDSSSLEYRNPKSQISVAKIENSSFMKEKYDVIFHLAARARIQPSFDNPVETISENFMNALRIFQKATEDQSRVIFASTSSSQGGSHITPYTFSKVAAEDMLKMYKDCYGTDGIVVRFFNVYGPREPKTGEWATVIAKFLEQYKKEKPLTIVGDGSQVRDFTHVRDICEGLFRISQIPFSTNVIELGRGEPLSIREVVNTFHVDGEEGRDFVYTPLRKGEPQRTEADTDLLKSTLGWVPTIRLFEYIEKEKENLCRSRKYLDGQKPSTSLYG
jgi:UDP-glucose 4-epimerase